MAFAQGSRSSLKYIAETTFGTTPSTPTMISLPFKTHSINLNKQRVEGNDIQSDRMPRIDRHGTRQAGGDISFDFRAGDYDEFLESAFFSTINTGVLKIGTTPKFLSIEDAAEDISQFRLFSGMAVSQMQFNIAPNQMIDTTATLVGQDGVLAQTTAAASTTAASGNAPFDSFSGVINEGGASIAVVSQLQFSIDNSLSPTFVVGSETTPQLEFGRAVVEGTLTAYFEDETLINKFINETESDIEVELSDPNSANTYTFLFPRVKYNGGDVPVQDPQSRLISIPFVALYDTTEDTNLKLTIT